MNTNKSKIFEEWFDNLDNTGKLKIYREDCKAWFIMGKEVRKNEVLNILKTKENFIGSGIKSAIEEINKL